MAKPTKTAPKRTNKSKTKKGKLDFLTNRINFKSRKTQFILTILVFALVGGAWFTYKSFAATEVYSYSPVNGTLKCYNKIVTSCSQISDTGIGKNSTTVLKFDGGHGSASGSSKAYIVAGSQYRTCVIAKSLGPVEFSVNPNVISFNDIIHMTGNGNSYQKACTIPWTMSTTGYQSVGVNPSGGATNITTYVERLTVERLSFDTPAPAPSK
jgi:hypothetical protein